MIKDETPLGIGPTIEVRGKGSAGKSVSLPFDIATFLFDITGVTSLGALTVYLLTHPLSPLEAWTRDFAPAIQRALGPSFAPGSLALMVEGGIFGIAFSFALVTHFTSTLPSIGRKILGIQNKKWLAGGGSLQRLLLLEGTTLIGAVISLILLGHLPVGLRSPLISKTLRLQPDDSIQKDLNWSVLPFFQLVGHWPIQIPPEVARILVGYAPGIVPAHYLPSVTFQWEESGTQLRIEGPKTDPRVHASLQALKQGISATDEALTLACTQDCLELIQNQRLQMKTTLGRESIQAIELQPWSGKYISGVVLHFQTASRDHWRVLAELPLQAHQALTWTEKRSEKRSPPELLQKLIAQLGTHPSLQEARAFTNDRLSRVNLTALLGEKGGVTDLPALLKKPGGRLELQSRKEALQGIQHLLLAKLTLEPGSASTFMHLAGTSYLLWKVAIALSDSGTSATARKVIRVTERYLQDFGPQAANELKSAQEILQEIDAFEKR